MMNRVLLAMFCACFSIFGVAQTYQPIDTADYLARKDFLTKNKRMNDDYIATLKSEFTGKSGREIVKNYEEAHDEFIKQVKDKDFTFQSNLTQYINSVVQQLQNKNPNIPKNLIVLVAKDNIPNAMCVDDGTFIVSLGLFNWLDNEDQLAAVLGHEIAHKLSNHNIKWQQTLLDINKQNESTVKQLKYDQLNVRDRAFDVFKNSLYKGSEQRRKNEEEADSLGYVLYKNTSYNKSDYIKALRNLEKFDTISPNVVEKDFYKKIFDLPDAPFKEKWLKMEDFSIYQYDMYKEKLDKDSLSSHPEIVARIELLQNNFPELKATSPTEGEENNKVFSEIKTIARMEILPNLFHAEEYGAGIYAAMQFLQGGEEEAYYKNWLGKCFEKIYEARKNYNLNRYLDRVDPKNQSESYQQFLNFMWNLSLDDIQKISDFYNKKGS